MGNSKYRLIAIDLDGTLLSPTGKVTERVRQAVHGALSAGLRVCFATGRNWTESLAILRDVGHYDSAVFVGGAMVVDTRQRITLHRTMMQPALAAAVCDALESWGHAVLALQDTHAAGADYLITAEAEINESTRRWLEATESVVHRTPQLGQHPHPHTIRVGICAPTEEVSRVKKVLNEQFGPRILCQSLFVPVYDVEVLEVFDPAVNKWQGIMHVARQHGIAPEQIIAIGDDINDLPMIQNAGLGIAMGNARPEVLAAAKRVIAANAEEGLAQFLEELILDHQVEAEHDAGL